MSDRIGWLLFLPKKFLGTMQNNKILKSKNKIKRTICSTNFKHAHNILMQDMRCKFERCGSLNGCGSTKLTEGLAEIIRFGHVLRFRKV